MGSVGTAPFIFDPVKVDFSLKSSSKAQWSATPVDIACRLMPDKKISIASDGSAISGKISNKASASMNFIHSEEQ